MTVIKHKEQRVGIFIDTQNLYHSAKNLYHARVNFGAIMKEVVANRALIRAVAYVITTETGEEKGFFEALEKLGIETKTKNIQIFNSGAKKADWDVGLAVDAIKMAPKLDTVIIASGDGDFIPLVEYLQTNEGCQVEVIAFGKSSSGRLREVTDDFIDMCLDPKKYTIGGQYGDSYTSKPHTKVNDIKAPSAVSPAVSGANDVSSVPTKSARFTPKQTRPSQRTSGVRPTQRSKPNAGKKHASSNSAVNTKEIDAKDDGGFMTSSDLAKIFGK